MKKIITGSQGVGDYGGREEEDTEKARIDVEGRNRDGRKIRAEGYANALIYRLCRETRMHGAASRCAAPRRVEGKGRVGRNLR